jgi:hypothetical protein
MDVISDFSISTWMEIGIALSVLMFGFLIGTLRQILKLKNKTKKDNKIDWKIHTEIHELLSELRCSTDSARTQLVQFHNGEYFMDGVSMKKLSLTHESLSQGVSAEGDKVKGLLISLFSPVIDKILKDESKIHLTKDEPESFAKNFLLSSNVNAYCVLPVKHENIISGYIAVHWCASGKVKEALDNSKEITDKIKFIRNQIQIQLDDQMRVK